MKLFFFLLLLSCAASFFQMVRLRVGRSISMTGETVEVEILPAGKTIKTKVGKNLIDLAATAGIKIPFQCRKGECKKCEVIFDGKNVLACKSKDSWSKVQITIGKKYSLDIQPPKKAK